MGVCRQDAYAGRMAQLAASWKVGDARIRNDMGFSQGGPGKKSGAKS